MQIGSDIERSDPLSVLVMMCSLSDDNYAISIAAFPNPAPQDALIVALTIYMRSIKRIAP